MALKIAQGFEYQQNDWWKWWVWLDGPTSELDQIDHVVYVLHPTFPNPVRVVKDRQSQFRFDTAGWGVFPIRAKVVHKDGKETHLEHDLVLEYPDGTQTTA
jgi:transcription initiation factor IIF auxiliary subunit